MKFLIVPALLISGFAMAQTPAPTLSTSDKVAIGTMEQQKQAAQKQFNDAQQQENSILQEWTAAHHGWHINPQTFAVEADAKSVAAKPVEPKK